MPTRPATTRALIEALWREMGGKLSGRVRDGSAPAGVKPSFEMKSPPLAEVVRDINKFSNNVMAQQLFLTLALQRQRGSRPRAEAAREVLRDWLARAHRRAPPGTVHRQRLGPVARRRGSAPRCWRGCCSRPGAARSCPS